jgi:nucleoside-diphosphate-sugar epimerase
MALTGGTGFVGSHVAERLIEQGHTVNCLVLPTEGPRWLEGLGVTLFEGSVTERASLGPCLEGCDAIVNVAGLTRAKTEAEFTAVNADGAVNLVEVALSQPGGPRHIVSLSSLAAVGPSPDDRGASEDDELRPLTPYGRSKASLEAALRIYEGRMHCTFIRAPGVYGPRDRDFFRYFKLVKRGLRITVGRDKVVSLVYVKTLASAVVSCICNPNAYGQAFFIADEGEYTWDEFAELVEAAMGKRTLRIQVPEWVFGVLAVASESAKPLFKNPPFIDKHKVLEARQRRWVVSTAKAKRLLGFEPAWTTAEALAETGRWYKSQGWI